MCLERAEDDSKFTMVDPVLTELDFAVEVARGVIKMYKDTSGRERAGNTSTHQAVMFEFPDGVNTGKFYADGSPRWRHGSGYRWFGSALPLYSTKESCAIKLLQELAGELPEGSSPILMSISNDRFHVWHQDSDIDVVDDTMSKAICLFYIEMKKGRSDA